MERVPEAGAEELVVGEPESPDWESLPEPLLANILRKASSPQTFAHGRVCKRCAGRGKASSGGLCACYWEYKRCDCPRHGPVPEPDRCLS